MNRYFPVIMRSERLRIAPITNPPMPPKASQSFTGYLFIDPKLGETHKPSLLLTLDTVNQNCPVSLTIHSLPSSAEAEADDGTVIKVPILRYT
jgi:hypothetical protein